MLQALVHPKQQRQSPGFAALEWKLTAFLSIILAAVNLGCSESLLGIFNWDSQFKIIPRFWDCQSPLEQNTICECCLAFLAGFWVKWEYGCNCSRVYVCCESGMLCFSARGWLTLLNKTAFWRSVVQIMITSNFFNAQKTVYVFITDNFSVTIKGVLITVTNGISYYVCVILPL